MIEERVNNIIRKFISRNGNGFSSCYMCASKEKYTSEWDGSLYTDTKYGLPICYKCIRDKLEYEENIIIEHHKRIEEIVKSNEVGYIIKERKVEDEN